MLVCNVTPGRPRRTIAADVAEAAAAEDAPNLDNALYASLIDDPANTNDTVNAFIGEIMLEPASAVEATDAALTYLVGIVENITAIESLDVGAGPTAYGVTIAEFANAVDVSDASKAGTVWDIATGTNIILSNANLTAAANTATQAQVRGSTSKSSGKYYFEVAVAFPGATQNSGVGISTSSPGGTTLVPANSAFVNVANSAVFVSGGNVGTSGGSFTAGSIACVAVDLANSRIWFSCNGINWNGNGTNSPATNVGGIDISAIFPSSAAFPIVTFTTTGLNLTANFVGPFTYSPPSGFSAWG